MANRSVMSGKQQSSKVGGGATFSHRQSQWGDNTSMLMGLSIGIIWPQMFFPHFLFVLSWSIQTLRVRTINLFGLVAGRCSARPPTEHELDQDMSKAWVSPAFAFSQTAPLLRPSVYSLNSRHNLPEYSSLFKKFVWTQIYLRSVYRHV